VKASPLIYAGMYVQLLPPAVALFARHRIGAPARWVALWCLLLFLEDMVGRAVAAAGFHNLWLTHVGAPVTGAVALWMLSLWHDGRTHRLALRLAIPPFIVVSVALSVLVDSPTTFSLFVAPFHALVLLLASLWTFLVRSASEEGRPATRDWFWILAGVMLYAGVSTAVQGVVAFVYGAGRDSLVLAVFSARAGATILAFAAIAGGMLCRQPPTHSGGPSWPLFSPSPSSWPGSRSP
jgi:hypothetical protein